MDIDKYLETAFEKKASDVHLRAGQKARIRIDGELGAYEELETSEEDIWKYLSKIIAKEKIEKYKETNELDFAFTLKNICRIRANLYKQREMLCVSMRFIPLRIPTLEELYLPPAVYNFVKLDKGLVLVTGPTGSGKSTTLAAMINYINQHRKCHIMTIEDPIEFVYEDKLATISQREVGLDTNTFAEALVHSFRQDPDVVLIGEMRDLETMQAAITLAETGHLTFSTLHTDHAAQTINRVIDSFPPHQQTQIRMQLVVSLQGIITQRLLPMKGKTGRVAAREVLVANSAVKNLIREAKVQQIHSAIQTGTEDGMITLNQSLGFLYEKGLIAFETALTASYDRKSFIAKYGT